MNETFCQVCQSPLDPTLPPGMCPVCLMKAGLPASGAVGKLDTTRSPSTRFQPPDPRELADHFPGLEIRSLIGVGGMGAVYLAFQKSLSRFVAIKILPSEVAADPLFAERFTREARTLAQLNHPHIVTVYEAGQSGPWYFLQMEYVDGITLRQAISDGQLSPGESLEIVRQVCDALAYAHEMRVVHRDIKPENVLIDRRGRVKIADFGLAKLLGEGLGDITLTRSHQVMGTFLYMAPEQIQTPNMVDHRADLYSLGVLFYELLTGHLPVGRFELPSEKGAGLNADWDAVVLRALERSPDRRYQQASDFQTDLRRIPRVATVNVANDSGAALHEGASRGASRGALAVEAAGMGAFAPSVGSGSGPQDQPHQSQTPHQDPYSVGPTAAFSTQPPHDRNASRTFGPPLAFFLGDDGHLGTGLARITETHLEIEYRVNMTGWLVEWGRVKPGIYVVGIPWKSIYAYRLTKNWMYTRLIVSVDSMQHVAQVPGTRNGELNLGIRRADRNEAQRFCDAIQERLTDPNAKASPASYSKTISSDYQVIANESNRIEVVGMLMFAFAIFSMVQALRSSLMESQPIISFDLIPWAWIQGTLVALAAWSRITRASTTLASLGAVALLIPMSQYGWLGLALGVVALTAWREELEHAFVLARSAQTNAWYRLFGLPKLKSTGEERKLDHRLRGIGIAAMFGSLSGIWLIATLTLAYPWVQDTEFAFIYAFSTPGVLAIGVAGLLITWRKMWGLALAFTCVAIVPLGIPHLLLMPLAIFVIVSLLDSRLKQRLISSSEADSELPEQLMSVSMHTAPLGKPMAQHDASPRFGAKEAKGNHPIDAAPTPSPFPQITGIHRPPRVAGGDHLDTPQEVNSATEATTQTLDQLTPRLSRLDRMPTLLKLGLGLDFLVALFGLGGLAMRALRYPESFTNFCNNLATRIDELVLPLDIQLDYSVAVPITILMVSVAHLLVAIFIALAAAMANRTEQHDRWYLSRMMLAVPCHVGAFLGLPWLIAAWFKR